MFDITSDKPSAGGETGTSTIDREDHQTEDKGIPPSVRSWHTPWHDNMDDKGVLVTVGDVQVGLGSPPIQWAIKIAKGKKLRKWDSKSFHRETGSLLRVLRQFADMREYSHVAADLVAVHSHLSALLLAPKPNPH